MTSKNVILIRDTLHDIRNDLNEREKSVMCTQISSSLKMLKVSL